MDDRRTNDGALLQKLTDLMDRLYDKDGDIPAIKEQLTRMNGKVNKNRNWLIALSAVVLGGGGTMWGIFQG